MPVLRRGVPAHLPRQGQLDSVRAGQGRPGELEPAVRQGPVRLRLRAAQASPHHAAHPQAGSDQAQGLHRRSGQLERGLPRSQLGRGARLSPPTSLRDIRDTHGKKSLAGFGSAKGTNEEAYLFQKLVRTGLRLEQRRSLHAPVPCLERRRADGGHQLGRRLEPGARRREGGGDLRDRREPHRQSSCRRDLDEERRQGRSEADCGGSAPQRSGPARDLLSPVQSRYRRGAPECDAPRHRRGGSRRRGVRPRSHLGIRRARREREDVLSGSDGPDLRHRRTNDPRGGQAVRDVEGLDDHVGDGDLAAHSRHRQRALPDRAGAVHRPDRQARLRACTRCAARTTCRARPIPG